MITFRLALRNVMLNKRRTMTVGLLMVFGTIATVVGAAAVDAIQRNSEDLVVNTATGEIHLYSTASKDSFYVGRSLEGFLPELADIGDYQRVASKVGALPNVRAMVPMTMHNVTSLVPSFVESRLAQLREAVRSGDRAQIGQLSAEVRRITEALAREHASRDPAREGEEARQDLDRACSASFWAELEKDPLPGLEFLENRIGPIGSERTESLYLRNIATDLNEFEKGFDRFRIVDGKQVPRGRRGFLFTKLFYENEVKTPIAVRLDRLRELRASGKRIASSRLGRRWIEDNVAQVGRLQFELSAAATTMVVGRLQKLLGNSQTDPAALLRQFMTMDDASFDARYRFFYDVIAPHIRLYSVAIGDEIVLVGPSRYGGYVRRIPVRVYGTYELRGAEKQVVAFNLLDFISYRDLEGPGDETMRKEVEAVRGATGLQAAASPAEVEKLLESDQGLVTELEKPSTSADAIQLGISGRRYHRQLYDRTYGRDELWRGPVRSIAVRIKDRRELPATLAAVRRTIEADKLGLRAIDWWGASGRLRGILRMVRAFVFGGAFLILMVTVIVLSNTVLMSTLERIPEIGTMRAIGAGKGLVLRLFVYESLITATIFGLLGSLAGYLIVCWLSQRGIPAWNVYTRGLFMGDHLFPVFALRHAINALIAVAAVAVGATLYPAWFGSRIAPRRAMATES